MAKWKVNKEKINTDIPSADGTIQGGSVTYATKRLHVDAAKKTGSGEQSYEEYVKTLGTERKREDLERTGGTKLLTKAGQLSAYPNYDNTKSDSASYSYTVQNTLIEQTYREYDEVRTQVWVRETVYSQRCVDDTTCKFFRQYTQQLLPSTSIIKSSRCEETEGGGVIETAKGEVLATKTNMSEIKKETVENKTDEFIDAEFKVYFDTVDGVNLSAPSYTTTSKSDYQKLQNGTLSGKYPSSYPTVDGETPQFWYMAANKSLVEGGTALPDSYKYGGGYQKVDLYKHSGIHFYPYMNSFASYDLKVMFMRSDDSVRETLTYAVSDANEDANVQANGKKVDNAKYVYENYEDGLGVVDYWVKESKWDKASHKPVSGLTNADKFGVGYTQIDFKTNNGEKFYPVESIGNMPYYFTNSSIDIVGLKAYYKNNGYPLCRGDRQYAIVGNKPTIFYWRPTQWYERIGVTTDKIDVDDSALMTPAYLSRDNQDKGIVQSYDIWTPIKKDDMQDDMKQYFNKINYWSCFYAYADTDVTAYQGIVNTTNGTSAERSMFDGAVTTLGGPVNDTVAYFYIDEDSLAEYTDFEKYAVWHWHLNGTYKYGRNYDGNGAYTGECNGEEITLNNSKGYFDQNISLHLPMSTKNVRTLYMQVRKVTRDKNNKIIGYSYTTQNKKLEYGKWYSYIMINDSCYPCELGEEDEEYLTNSLEKRRFWETQNKYRFQIYVDGVPYHWDCDKTTFNTCFEYNSNGELVIKNREELLKKNDVYYSALVGDYCINADAGLPNKTLYNAQNPILIPEYSGAKFVKNV